MYLRIQSYFATNLIVNFMGNAKWIKPTDSELEILQVLWQRENATVREVHEELTQVKDCGYTTTLKLMQIMFEKGLVLRDDSSRTHIYTPNVSRDDTQKNMVDKMVDALFSGSRTQLVVQALGNHTPTKEELLEIELLLQKFKSQN